MFVGVGSLMGVLAERWHWWLGVQQSPLLGFICRCMAQPNGLTGDMINV